MPHPLDEVRFQPERALIDHLFEQFALEEHIDHFERSGEAGRYYEFVMSTQLRLTPLLAPRLCTLLDQARERIRFDHAVELYVAPDSVVNAFALHSLAADQPHVVSLTAGMVERMTDAELLFALGHELGHLHYRHYRALLIDHAIGQDERGNSRVPPLLGARMQTWSRLAELSADRAGLVAVDGDLDTIVSAFFKLASGLGPEHLRFDISAFLEQLEDLQKMKRRDVLATFSHPVTPVRVRALQLFTEAGGSLDPSGGAGALEPVDADIARIARLLDYEVTKELDVHARDFLLAGGLLAAHSDEEGITDDQWQLLINLLLPLTSDPEAQIDRIETVEQAQARLEETAAWLRDNAGEERFFLFRQLAHMVAVDGRLQAGEQELMTAVAALLHIPDKAANEMVYEVLAGYLQTRADFSNRPMKFG